MKTITIQPKEQADFTLPYPFHINEDGSVGRQDFWKGKPQRLLGFNDKPEMGDIKLFVKEFWKRPKLAIGMYPVFKKKTGGWVTHIIPIESVSVNKK